LTKNKKFDSGISNGISISKMDADDIEAKEIVGLVYDNYAAALSVFNQIKRMPICVDTDYVYVIDLHCGDDLIDTIGVKEHHGEWLLDVFFKIPKKKRNVV